jgi:FixJ family two-component response regulator
MSSPNRSTVARRAVRTRQARNEFRTRFGQTTYDIVALVRLGVATNLIASQVGVSPTTVSAVRANLTRGTYSPFVWATRRGSANL